jgi:hypothetical protein
MLEYERDGVERKYPYCDYELLPLAPWNYAYCSEELSVQRNGAADVPFAEKLPPVVIKAKVIEIDWGLEDGYEKVCAKVPQSLAPISGEKEVALIPYGCAKLRMTELPFIEG